MSVSHDSYNFGGSLVHGDIVEGPYELPVEVSQFFGVIGESHIPGYRYGREIFLDVQLDGYLTHALITAAIDAIKTKEGRLTGTLTISTGSISRTLPKCTFVKFEHGPPWPGKPYQASAYVCLGRLIWRQRSPTT